jgi:hypothetical protein
VEAADVRAPLLCMMGLLHQKTNKKLSRFFLWFLFRTRLYFDFENNRRLRSLHHRFGSGSLGLLCVWTCCTACYVAWAVLRAILEEAQGAVAKVKQHANTGALLVAACLIVVFLAVAVQGSIVSRYEPAISAVSTEVHSCGIKVGPADSDQDA